MFITPIKGQGADIGSRLRSELDQDKQSVRELEQIIGKVDSLSEELRLKRKQIADLETERNALLQSRDKMLEIARERDMILAENRRLETQMGQLRAELSELKQRRQIENEKCKRSFDEMDALVEKEREAHRVQEEALRQANAELVQKVQSLTAALDQAKLEGQKQVETFAEQMDVHQGSRKQLLEAAERAKQRESECEEKCREAQNETAVFRSNCTDLQTQVDKLRAEVFKLAQYQSLFGIEKDKVGVFVQFLECAHEEGVRHAGESLRESRAGIATVFGAVCGHGGELLHVED